MVLLDIDAPVLSLSRAALLEAQARGAVVVDTRDADRFAAGHWPGSVHLDVSRPAAWVTELALRGNAEIALISDPGTEVEVRNQLACLGLQRIAGVLAGGLGPFDAERLISGVWRSAPSA